MIKINTIDHINMFTQNLEASLEFYKNFFNFEVKERGTNNQRPYAITGISQKMMIALYEVEQLPSQGRINHIGIHIQDFDETLAQLKNRGIKTLYGNEAENGAVKYDCSRSVYIADPDGNEIELSEKFGGGL